MQEAIGKTSLYTIVKTEVLHSLGVVWVKQVFMEITQTKRRWISSTAAILQTLGTGATSTVVIMQTHSIQSNINITMSCKVLALW